MRLRVQRLTECSMMIAFSFVLSIFKLAELPYGGSVTMASMLPMVIIAHRHSIRWGISTAIINSLIQLLLGLKYFAYFSNWQSLVALALFDYIIAFAIFGLAGIFRKSLKNQSLAVVAGAFFASVIRYICHVISGATIWAGLSIPTEAALVYSLSYNATYMIPETIILVLTAGYLASALDFRKKELRRLKSEKLDNAAYLCVIIAGLVVLAALIADTVLVFSKLQSYDSGEFMITALADVNWLTVGIITATALAAAAVLVIIARNRMKKLR